MPMRDRCYFKKKNRNKLELKTKNFKKLSFNEYARKLQKVFKFN